MRNPDILNEIFGTRDVSRMVALNGRPVRQSMR